jgi:hypothetical protein
MVEEGFEMTSRQTAGDVSDSPARSRHAMHARNELREKLAELEHIQWQAWSTTILGEEEISPARRERWQQCLVPYDQLPEAMKEYDREWADKVLDILDALRQEDRDEPAQAPVAEPEPMQRAPWWKRLFS